MPARHSNSLKRATHPESDWPLLWPDTVSCDGRVVGGDTNVIVRTHCYDVDTNVIVRRHAAVKWTH